MLWQEIKKQSFKTKVSILEELVLQGWDLENLLAWFGSVVYEFLSIQVEVIVHIYTQTSYSQYSWSFTFNIAVCFSSSPLILFLILKWLLFMAKSEEAYVKFCKHQMIRLQMVLPSFLSLCMTILKDNLALLSKKD